MTEEQLILILWGIAGTFVLLFILALTNRVTVFYDKVDFWWAISPVAFLIIGYFIQGTLGPEEGRIIIFEKGYDYSTWETYHYLQALTLLSSVFGFVMTFILSIRYNGLVLGVLVGIFKMLSALLLSILLLGLLPQAFNKNNTSAQGLLILVLFGWIGWILGKLMNGAAVEKRKTLNTN